LALRIAVPKTGQPWIDRQNVASYTSMQADRVEVTRNGRIQAEITASGRLCDVNGEVLGEFTQRFQITRGSRILVVEIELTPRTALLDDPWESYFACRFAWADEAALLRGGARWQSQEMERKRIEAPLFVDIESGTQHTTVLSGGLPYHRRISPKQLDTLLLAAGEQAAEFRLGVGVDLPSAPRAALDFLAGPAPAVATGSPPGSGWFFHLDAKNVLATCWQPLAAPQRGFQVRLLETEGRAANVRVQAIRPLESAYLVDGQGEPIRELKIDGGAAEVHLHAYQFAEVQAHW
jgi:alpha-mannosidase